jgi:hypothetical protein
MAKFKMKLKLSGLELEVEGERSDVPKIMSNVGEQISGMLTPAANIAADRDPNQAMLEFPAAHADGSGQSNNKPKKPRRKTVTSREVSATDAQPVEWRHEPDKWGNPKQGWSIRKKILWLLYVAEHAASAKEMAAAVVCSTFNKHFRQTGTLHPPLVTRELGRAKTTSPPLVGEDTTKAPSNWFLLDKGREKAVQLVAEAKGESPAAPDEE